MRNGAGRIIFRESRALIKFIFNIDCLINTDSLFDLIAERFNAARDTGKISRLGIDDNLPYMESLIKYVHLLGKFSISEAAACIAAVPLHKDAASFLLSHPENCVLTGEYPSCWMEKLCGPFSCESYFSEAVTDKDRIKKLASILKKENIVKQYKDKGYKTVFIGCGDNDMEAMRISDTSVAAGLNGKPARSILTLTDYLVFSEKALCRQLNQLL